MDIGEIRSGTLPRGSAPRYRLPRLQLLERHQRSRRIMASSGCQIVLISLGGRRCPRLASRPYTLAVKGRPWTGSWTGVPDNPSVVSAVSAMIRVIYAVRTLSARGSTLVKTAGQRFEPAHRRKVETFSNNWNDWRGPSSQKRSPAAIAPIALQGPEEELLSSAPEVIPLGPVTAAPAGKG